MNTQALVDVFRGSVSANTDPGTVSAFLNTCSQVGIDLGLNWFIDSGLTNAQVAMVMRSAISARFDRITEVIQHAAANGYLLPDNPLIRINQLNQGRQLFSPLIISPQEDTLIVNDSIELSKVVAGVDAGTITFDRPRPGFQLSAMEASLDGISVQSGDPLSDILGYQPDADFVKRKQALDSLARLDFSQRKPYMLFTADLIQDGRRTAGTVICWMRMRDASSYSIGKRDVFAEIDFPPNVYTNASLEESTARLLADPNFAQVMSFYDWVHPGDVFATVDDSTFANTLFSFQVVGQQKKAPATPFIFNVPMSALHISAAQAADIRSLIAQDLTNFNDGTDQDSVSPYPAISQKIFGDPGYGWILAGCNVQASRTRGDSSDVTRSLSYIGSKISNVLALAAAGKIYAPSDLSIVQSSVAASISSFGVSQTILSVLDGIGVTFFVSGKDDPNGFQPISPSSLEGSTGGLAKILSAIDPESATLDPHVLAATLTTHGNVGGGARYIATATTTPPQTFLIQAEVSTNPDAVSPTLLIPASASGPGAPPPITGILGDRVIDLTTYLGIADLVGLIRTIYDFYPGTLT